MKTVAVFSGGGIKGYTEAYFSKLIDLKADMYAGTSIGGLIACARSNGKDWDEIIKLFQDRGNEIFKRKFFHNIKLLWRSHRYNNKGLHKALVDFFGEERMGALSPVCITAMGIIRDNYGPHYFSELSKESIVDVCMATSAAPSYFRPYMGYVDGGVFMNNPVMYAVLMAKKRWPKEKIKIITISAGHAPPELGEPKNGLDMADDLVQNFMQGNSMAAQEMAEKFQSQLGIDELEAYDFHYPRPVTLDDTSKGAFEIMRKAAYEEFTRTHNEKLL